MFGERKRKDEREVRGRRKREEGEGGREDDARPTDNNEEMVIG